VVFPAPLGPSKPKISLLSTVMLSLSTAVSCPNRLVRSTVSITLAMFFQQTAFHYVESSYIIAR
jgi:hypothetical protein